MNRSLSDTLFNQLPRGYRVDRRLGAVYEIPPSRADDLMLLHGLGAREANGLNRLGVYFLAQVALWDNHELCAIADELGMTATTLADERWVQQAQMLCLPRTIEYPSHSRHLPASFVRTISLLACALLVGFMFVYWLSMQVNQPLRGILSADVTALKVPADARLVTAHVSPGDEVFCGERLLTLEKTEHLAIIDAQEERLRSLERQLLQAKAQAGLDLESRTRELERELSDVRTRAHLIQQVKRNPAESIRSAAVADPAFDVTQPSSARSRFVSRQEAMMADVPAPITPERKTARANGIIFIGAESSATAAVKWPQSQSTPEPTAPEPSQQFRNLSATPMTEEVVPTPTLFLNDFSETQRIAMVLASENSGSENLLAIEARDVEQRLQRLESLKETLPEQVRRAAGVESLRVQYEEAAQRLDEMKALSRDVSVVCPAHGKVSQIRYKAGDTMPAGESLLRILHTDRRYVMVNVPTHRVNEIEPGTVMDLTFPGNERLRGRVVNLPMLAESAHPSDVSIATVRVEPIGKLWPEIPIGSHVDVMIRSQVQRH